MVPHVGGGAAHPPRDESSPGLSARCKLCVNRALARGSTGSSTIDRRVHRLAGLAAFTEEHAT